MSTLISPDSIISYRDLTCSSDVRLSFCRAPTCCSLGYLYVFTLGTYNCTYLGLLEGSTERTTCGNLDVLLLGGWLGSLYGIELGTNFGNYKVLSDGKVLGTTLGSLVGI